MFDAYAVDADTLPDLDLDDLLVFGLRGSTARGLRARFRKSPVTLSLMGAKSDRWLAANLDNPFRDWADDDAAAGAAACKAYATALKALGTLIKAPSSPRPDTGPPATATSPDTGLPATPASPDTGPPVSASPDTDSPVPASGLDTDPPPTFTGTTTESVTTTTGSSAGSVTTFPGPRTEPVAAVTGSVIISAETVLRELVEKLNALDERFDIIDTVRREEAGDAFMALSARAGVPSPTAGEWFDAWREF